MEIGMANGAPMPPVAMAVPAEPRPVRIGILGTAKIADKLAWAVEQSGSAVVTCVASRSLERAQDWATRLDPPAVATFGSYAELLESGACDAVYIALPSALHAEWAQRSAEAGLHVLCEKPLCASVDEARAVVYAAADARVALMDGMMWVHHPRTADMLSAIGDLGAIRRITACLSFGAAPEFWSANIRADADLEPLGALGDLGYYCAAVAQSVMRHQWPVRVLAHIEWSNPPPANPDGPGGAPKRGVPLAATATLVYSDGASATFHCGFDAARRNFLEVHCVGGVLRCDDWVHPCELDTYGTPLTELRKDPPEARRAGYLTRAAGETQWTEHESAACHQEVHMVRAFCALVRSAPDPGQSADDPRREAYEAAASGWREAALQVQTVLCGVVEAAGRGGAMEIVESESLSMVAADPACPTPSGDDQAEMEGDGDVVMYSGQNGATPPPLPTAEESLIGGAKRMRTSDERERDAAAVMRAAASKWLRDTQDGVQPAPMASRAEAEEVAEEAAAIAARSAAEAAAGGSMDAALKAVNRAMEAAAAAGLMTPSTPKAYRRPKPQRQWRPSRSDSAPDFTPAAEMAGGVMAGAPGALGGPPVGAPPLAPSALAPQPLEWNMGQFHHLSAAPPVPSARPALRWAPQYQGPGTPGYASYGGYGQL